MTYQEKKSFIASNWHVMDDTQLANITMLSERSVQRYRMELNLKKDRFNINDKSGIGLVLELFANGSKVANIAKLTRKSDSSISKLLNKYFFFKQRSLDTVTLILDSKINYSPN